MSKLNFRYIDGSPSRGSPNDSTDHRKIFERHLWYATSKAFHFTISRHRWEPYSHCSRPCEIATFNNAYSKEEATSFEDERTAQSRSRKWSIKPRTLRTCDGTCFYPFWEFETWSNACVLAPSAEIFTDLLQLMLFANRFWTPCWDFPLSQNSWGLSRGFWTTQKPR
jgi:hypothetical protein